ncbi:MAG TPA: SGNH/GDSL hydrolase family protein [Friedmanniella sp.]
MLGRAVDRLRASSAGHRRTPLVALVLVLLTLGTACTPTPAPPPPTCTFPDPGPTLVRGSLVLPANPTVLLLGDSYTEGYGADPETKGWAYLVGKPLGWRVTVNGFGGTGYTNVGPNEDGTYLQRLPSLAGRSFDLVVIQGGSNDRDVDYPTLRDAVTQTVAAVRAEFPGTAVLLLGPATPYGKADDPARIEARCVLAGYAVQQHVSFVDPLGESWFVDGDGKKMANPVNGHPSNAGYRRIAARFETDIRVLTGRSRSS